MDSPFGEDCTALLLIERSGRSSLMYVTKQLIKPAGTKNHQGPRRHGPGIAKLMRHISRNHDHRTRFCRKPFIARLHLVSSFENVIELFVSIMDVQRYTLAGHCGHFTDAERALRLAAANAGCRAPLRRGLERPYKNRSWLRFHAQCQGPCSLSSVG